MRMDDLDLDLPSPIIRLVVVDPSLTQVRMQELEESKVVPWQLQVL